MSKAEQKIDIMVKSLLKTRLSSTLASSRDSFDPGAQRNEDHPENEIYAARIYCKHVAN